MAKAYWVNTYRSISKPEALAAYAKLAGPAILAMGGRFVARGMPVRTYEAGLNQRTVVVEFDSREHAVATHDCPGYAEALRALDGGAVRDMRLLDGVEASPGARRSAPPGAYLVNAYHSLSNAAALDAYIRLADPAVAAGGGRFLIRGKPFKVYESGMMERTAVVEFDSLQALLGTYDGPAYAAALNALGKDAAVRDMRVMEGAA